HLRLAAGLVERRTDVMWADDRPGGGADELRGATFDVDVDLKGVRDPGVLGDPDRHFGRGTAPDRVVGERIDDERFGHFDRDLHAGVLLGKPPFVDVAVDRHGVFPGFDRFPRVQYENRLPA